MTPDTVLAALCGVLTALGTGAGIVVGIPALRRLRYRRAVRRYRIRQIEDAYERDMRR